jgi:hypothetical protein
MPSRRQPSKPALGVARLGPTNTPLLRVHPISSLTVLAVLVPSRPSCVLRGKDSHALTFELTSMTLLIVVSTGIVRQGRWRPRPASDGELTACGIDKPFATTRGRSAIRLLEWLASTTLAVPNNRRFQALPLKSAQPSSQPLAATQ